eukprot:IDg12199t1
MTSCFAVAMSPWCMAHGVTRAPMTMGRRRTFRKPSSGPSPPTPERRAQLEEVAKGFGVEAPRLEDQLDENARASSGRGVSERTLYMSMESAVGRTALETFERALIALIGTLLAAFLSLGLAISSAAFFKATGSDIPGGLNSFIDSGEPLFTPIFVVFLVLSSTLGLYKQSQLNSGGTGYEGKRKDT